MIDLHSIFISMLLHLNKLQSQKFTYYLISNFFSLNFITIWYIHYIYKILIKKENCNFRNILR